MRLHLVVRLAGVLMALAWLPLAGAAPVKETKPSTTESPAQKLKKELDVAISVEIEMPLVQAINELREQTKLNIVLDKVTVLMMGIDPDSQAVTLKGKNIKLRSGLRTLLAQCNLTYVIVGDNILITTEEMAVYRQFKQRVSLEVDKVELKTALKKLSADTAVNIVVDPKVAKEAATAVTLEVDEVPLESAVRLLAEQAGLKAARVGNVILITTKEAARGLQAEGELVPRPNLTPGGEAIPSLDAPVAPGVVPRAIPGGGGAEPPPADEKKNDKAKKEDR